MVTTFPPRNGTGAARKPFPRQPVLLAPVVLPFKGTFEHVTINFNVSVVQDLLDHSGAQLSALNADLTEQETALNAAHAEQRAALHADTSLPLEDRTAALDALDRETDDHRGTLWLEAAWRVIARTVDSVEWEYTEPPPDPQRPETWANWPPVLIVWIGQQGIQAAGVQFGAGPLARQVRASESWSITASLVRTLNTS